VIGSVLDKHEETYRRIWEENRKLVRYLRQADAPIPEALGIVARHVLEQTALDELGRLEAPGPLPERLLEILAEASALGLPLDMAAAKPRLQAAVERALEAVAAEPTPERVALAQRLIEDLQMLKLRFGLWSAQNRFFDIWRRRTEARAALAPLGTALGFNLDAEKA
jgi:hypothetical protein